MRRRNAERYSYSYSHAYAVSLIVVGVIVLLPQLTLAEECCCCNGQIGSACVTVTPSITAAPTLTGTITNTPTRTNTATATRTVTPTPANTNTPTVVNTATNTATFTNTATSTATPTNAAGLTWCDDMIACWEMEEATGANRANTGGSCGANCLLTDNGIADITQDTTNFVVGAASAGYGGLNQLLGCNLATCSALNIGTTASWGCFARWVANTAPNVVLTCSGGAGGADLPNYSTVRNTASSRGDSSVTINGGAKTTANGVTTSWVATPIAWHHVGASFDDSSNVLQQYLDGKPDGTPAAPTSMGVRTTEQFRIGSQDTSGAWNGSIDECFVTNCALSAPDWCRICSCGANGSLCTCSGASYVSTGRNSSCGSCTLPANCNQAAPACQATATSTPTGIAATATRTSTATATSTSTPTATATSTPTSVTVNFDAVCSSGNCATVSNASGSYPPAGILSILSNFLNPSRTLSGGAFQVQLGLIRWDTSSLPDGAVVTSCTLEIKTSSEAPQNADTRNITAAWAAAESAWNTSDYDVNAGTDALSGNGISTFSINTVYDLPLSNCAANVDLTSFTGLKLWADGGQPTGQNYVDFKTSVPSPRLIVVYHE